MLNHFVCLEVVEELPTDSIHQIYYRDCRGNARYVKIDYPVSVPSSSDDTLSLIFFPLSVP